MGGKARKEIKIFYLPAYSPELNPDELVNSDLKLGVGQREPAADKEKLECQVREHMECRLKAPPIPHLSTRLLV